MAAYTTCPAAFHGKLVNKQTKMPFHNPHSMLAQQRKASCAAMSQQKVVVGCHVTADGAQPHLGRREMLQQAAVAALLPLMLSHLQPAASFAAGGPRLPSPEVQAALDTVLKRVEKTKAPVLLRLVFHDAGTYNATTIDGGLNASIRFELSRPENFGLKRGWNVIEALKSGLKGTAAEGQVSYADLIALAGARAVALCGGPSIAVPIGRTDASEASGDPTGRLPSENASAAQLKGTFAAMGFSTKEFIALSGAHTLGNKGFGDPLTFDNVYYKEMLRKPWNDPKVEMASMMGLPSDHVVADDAECVPFIQEYAADQDAFFRDFAAAYIKLTGLGVQWA